jgi:ADP-L-glycero-D-manno-heptose 6-epimerase
MSHLVWVTGAAGFIGFRLVEKCLAEGMKVVGIDRLDHFKNRTEHLKVNANAQFHRVDRDLLFQQMNDLLKTHPPEVIFHLGACADTMNLDVEYHRVQNIEYSQKLWDLCARFRIPLVYASSAAVYGDGSLGYSDQPDLTSKYRALNPYGESKRLFDVWALEQAKKNHAPPTWSGFRFFNVYGFGEGHKGKMASVVYHSALQIEKEGKVKLFQSHKTGIADGHQKRDFVCVEDVIDVLLFAARKPIASGIFNLGTGRAQTFLDLVKAVFQTLAKKECIEFIPTPESLRDKYQYFTEADLTRLRAEGYRRPFKTLDEAVPPYLERLRRMR